MPAPLVTAALISGGFGLAQSGLSYLSGRQAASGQRDANNALMAFNAAEAEKSRAHQIRMYQHRYQWARQDLEQAGYNPMLAVNAGSVGVPSSPQASVSTLKSEKEESSRRYAEAGLLASQTAKGFAEALHAKKLAEKTDVEKQIIQDSSKPRTIQPFVNLIKSVAGPAVGTGVAIYAAKQVAKMHPAGRTVSAVATVLKRAGVKKKAWSIAKALLRKFR